MFSSSLEYDKIKGTGVLNLSGSFDENATLPDPEGVTKITTLYVNFGRVRFINSSGIGTWVLYVRKILELKSDLQFIFQNCPKVIIDQVNTVESFLPDGGEVESFKLPIFCELCEKSFAVNQFTKDFKPDELNAADLIQSSNCNLFPGCKKDFVLDVLPAVFFRFLKKKK